MPAALPAPGASGSRVPPPPPGEAVAAAESGYGRLPAELIDLVARRLDRLADFESFRAVNKRTRAILTASPQYMARIEAFVDRTQAALDTADSHAEVLPPLRDAIRFLSRTGGLLSALEQHLLEAVLALSDNLVLALHDVSPDGPLAVAQELCSLGRLMEQREGSCLTETGDRIHEAWRFIAPACIWSGLISERGDRRRQMEQLLPPGSTLQVAMSVDRILNL